MSSFCWVSNASRSLHTSTCSYVAALCFSPSSTVPSPLTAKTPYLCPILSLKSSRTYCSTSTQTRCQLVMGM
ncbi:hypothetical protein DPMN_185885 [Dreissena polymorpha]|uniref:Uncharacterized protein n=1 Tax=Dreissena polymorpha TaxID=45954 RepID=A0A9D4I941_DREPO|nr:hypothetical protein DPMN_185885 [Dreissena polymorpha]